MRIHDRTTFNFLDLSIPTTKGIMWFMSNGRNFCLSHEGFAGDGPRLVSPPHRNENTNKIIVKSYHVITNYNNRQPTTSSWHRTMINAGQAGPYPSLPTYPTMITTSKCPPPSAAASTSKRMLLSTIDPTSVMMATKKHKSSLPATVDILLHRHRGAKRRRYCHHQQVAAPGRGASTGGDAAK